MKNVIVKTQALKKYYQTGNQTVRALDGVNFEVAEREFVSIVGKSGSGKSTLLHMSGGLESPSSGTVIVDGLNPVSYTHLDARNQAFLIPSSSMR